MHKDVSTTLDSIAYEGDRMQKMWKQALGFVVEGLDVEVPHSLMAVRALTVYSYIDNMGYAEKLMAFRTLCAISVAQVEAR